MKMLNRLLQGMGLVSIALSAQAQVKKVSAVAATSPAATPPVSKKGVPNPKGKTQISSVAKVGSNYKIEDDNKRISFDSLRYWRDSRWFVIGEWVGADSIRWVGGKTTKFKFPRAECGAPEEPSTLVRPEDYVAKIEPGKKKPLNHEILHNRNWVAVEVSYSVESETFVVRSARFKDNPDCKAPVKFEYGWKGEPTELKPILFLKPKDFFFGHEIILYVPEKPERANIQLDLYLGYWRGSFPNAKISTAEAAEIAAGRKPARKAPSKSITFVPTAISRGEWLLPMQKHIGFTLSLEQSLMSMGGVSGQPVLFSDWTVGTFFQQIIPAFDGLQYRLFAKYHEHLADQGTAYSTMADANRQAKNLILGTTLNHYFARRWLLGADFEYGFPNRMAGRGVTQGYMAYSGRLGFRMTTFMLIVGEVGFRNYKAEGFETEKVLQSNLGIRLEL